MNNIATSALSIRSRALFLIFFLALGGCSLPRPASSPVVVDFGPGLLPAASPPGQPALPPVEISLPQAGGALAGVAVLYRLGYADAQALQSYTLTRWSMLPAQLIDQRLRQHLSQQRPVLSTGELLPAGLPQRATAAASRAAATAAPPPATALLNLRITLEEFSQWFATPSQSSGLLRLRATLMLRGAGGDTLLAQRNFVVQQPAPSPDASGGVRALTAAADLAISDIAQWLVQVAPATPATPATANRP